MDSPLNQDAIIDFSRAQAIRGLENALKTVNLKVSDLELVDCLRADILVAQQQNHTEENDSSFFSNRNKTERKWQRLWL